MIYRYVQEPILYTEKEILVVFLAFMRYLRFSQRCL